MSELFVITLSAVCEKPKEARQEIHPVRGREQRQIPLEPHHAGRHPAQAGRELSVQRETTSGGLDHGKRYYYEEGDWNCGGWEGGGGEGDRTDVRGGSEGLEVCVG